MNKGLAHILLSKIGDIPFIDLYGGIVSIQEQVDSIRDDLGAVRRVVKRYPVTCDFIQYGDCGYDPGELVAMIPDSSRKGIIYFEDLGVQSLGMQSIWMRYRSRIRLVCWLNTKYVDLNACGELTMPVITTIISRIGSVQFNQNNYLGIQATVVAIPRQDKSIFAGYTYEEAYVQYLMPPFEYIAIDFDITYRVNPECISQIQLVEPLC